MTELLHIRAAQNQSLFREYNERIETTKAVADTPWLTDWVCECAQESCSVPVRLTLAEYESIRAEPTHFLVAPSDDHCIPEVERVIERHERYWVVEKIGRAAEVSESREPASRGGAAQGTRELEDLARRYFALFNAQALDELREILHPEVVLELKAVQPGAVLRGRDEVIRFVEQECARRLWETVVHACKPLGANGVVVAGRIRWMDDDRVLRDDPRLWALEFRDGLLIRSLPVQTVGEAESVLASPDRSAEPD